jgi:hypothetical protein
VAGLGGRIVRLIAAILGGYVLIGILVVLTDRLFAILIPGFAGMVNPPLYYFLLSLGTDFVYSILGGYVCCRIARSQSREAMIGLIALGETIGVFSQFLLWQTVPHWFAIGLLVLYPIAVWIGSRFRRLPETAAA